MTDLKEQIIGKEVRDAMTYLDSVVDDDHHETVNTGLRRIMMTGVCLGGAIGAGLVLLLILILNRMI